MSKCMKFHLGVFSDKHHEERVHEMNKKTYPNCSLLPYSAAVLPSVAVPNLGSRRSSNSSTTETKLFGVPCSDAVCEGYPLASACLTAMQRCWVSLTCLEFCKILELA